MDLNTESIRKLFKNNEMQGLYYNEKKSAVIIPLVYKNGKLSILFEVRSKDIIQGGEVCFPGGLIENDESAVETATREIMEELLIKEDDFEIICPLFFFAGPSGMEIKSYLGLLNEYDFTYSPEEVDHVFTVPVTWFFENSPLEYRAEMELNLPEDYPFELIPGGRDYPFRANPRTFYFYKVKDEIIWGMTANLLHEFIDLLKNKVDF